MRRNFIFLVVAFCSIFASAQNQELKLNQAQIEKLFLEQNLQLLAQKMNVDMADAEILQAKLWDNPELSLGSLNLWSTEKQRGGEAEVIPPLAGSFGRNTEFSLELSQLIQTANKRGKMVAREQRGKEIAQLEFEDLMRNLRIELRSTTSRLLQLQQMDAIVSTQHQSLDQLILAYRKMVEQGNKSKTELLRLQSSLLELESGQHDLKLAINEQQRFIKQLLKIEPSNTLTIEDTEKNFINPSELLLPDLLNKASNNRPDLQKQKAQTRYFEASERYEKSLRVPNLTLSASYDRAGGVWSDFVGFGLSFELPFLNRNQGNIKIANISKNQSELLTQESLNTVLNEVTEAYLNYQNAYDFYKRLQSNSLIGELDELLNNYTKNLLAKNISMLEYLDFFDSYKSNKEIYLNAKFNLSDRYNELEFKMGSSF